MLIVSACLAGRCTRYDGSHSRGDAVARMVAAGKALALCPEQLGGLPTPRHPAEIKGPGDGAAVLDGIAAVVDQTGRDVTDEFVRGAHEVLRLARVHGVTRALLKDKSPSCGAVHIYKQGKAVQGMGVTAALLARHGIRVNPVREQVLSR